MSTKLLRICYDSIAFYCKVKFGNVVLLFFVCAKIHFGARINVIESNTFFFQFKTLIMVFDFMRWL